MRHREHRLEHVRVPNFSPMRSSSISCVHPSRTQSSIDVVENAGDDGFVVAAVAREDDRDVGRMREVGQGGALPHLAVVVLGRERERVVDAVGIARHCPSGVGRRARVAMPSS